MKTPDGPLFGRGTLRMWDDEKGFGFIEPQEGGDDVFLHISALGERQNRPTVGALVTYRRITDYDKGPRAVKARLENAAQRAKPTFAPRPNRLVTPATPQRLPPRTARARFSQRSQLVLRASLDAAIFLTAVAGAALVKLVPWWVPAVYVIASGVTFIVYALDKTSALEGEWRVSESTLHLLEFLGGWPGARLAQQCLRHKTVKGSYQVIFWLIVATHLGFWTWLALRRSGVV